METECPSLSSQRLQPPLTGHPEETQDEKAQDTGPTQRAEVQSKGMISVSPDSCIFPYRKALNSLRCLVFFN